MVSENTVVKGTTGLHARPAAQLVALIKTFQSKVTISTSAKAVNGASMISILSLGLKSGSEIEIKAEGEDEVQAVKSVVAFFENMTE